MQPFGASERNDCMASAVTLRTSASARSVLLQPSQDVLPCELFNGVTVMNKSNFVRKCM